MRFTAGFTLEPWAMFKQVLIFLALLRVSVAEGGQEQFAESTCEEADDLRLSLLQSSLQVAKAPVERNVSAAPEQHALFDRYADAAKQARMMAKKQLNFVMQLVLPTEKTALSGIPALLVFMLAGLVMALFVVQLIGVMFEEKKSAPFRPGGPTYSQSTAPGTLPPMTLPNSPPSRASMARPGAGSASAPSTVSTLPVRGHASARPSHAPDGAAMCPALISPSAEAHFTVPRGDLNSLNAGTVGPVAILGGQTGKALLYARFKADSKERRWLELSTTANSRFPHCSAGPMDTGLGQSRVPVEIRGPRGDRYGTLQKESSLWQLYRFEGQLVKSISTKAGSFTATDGQQHVATGRVDDETFEVLVSPGRDPLLTLLCMLAILLTSPGDVV